MKNDYLKRLKEATEKLTRWDSSKKAFGHYKVLVAPEKKVDRLYEFWCLLTVLDKLRAKYHIKCIPETRSDKKIFPQSPAPKKGWAYFEIKDKIGGTNQFQVCYGTQIKLSTAPKTSIAPDISFQMIDASDDPDETMVEMIMDAKYKYNPNKSLTFSEINIFIQWDRALKTENIKDMELVFLSLFDEYLLTCNCLITNGRSQEKHNEYCKQFYIKQIEKYDLDSVKPREDLEFLNAFK